MEESLPQSHRLTRELTRLFDLESHIDNLLSVSMYYLNEFMDSERSSIFLFQHITERLAVFSSLDLQKQEVSIPKSCGVVGWVFVNRKAAIVNNAYEDGRFYKEVDAITGFHTRKMICAPIFDIKDNCLGTIQSLNKTSGDFTSEDLELLKLASRMLGAAIESSQVYTEVLVASEVRRKFIHKICDDLGDFSVKSKTI